MCCAKKGVPPEECASTTLIDTVFPDTFERRNAAILTPRNDSVDRINALAMKKFLSERSMTYYSADAAADETQAHLYPTEFLNTLNLSGLPPHVWHPKKGATAMLFRNFEPRSWPGQWNSTVSTQSETDSHRNPNTHRTTHRR